jgi:putative salt-induced outer membrane protein
MRTIRICTFLLAACVAASSAVITLENGDRVTGDVIESNDTTLKVATVFLGEVEIAWASVTRIESKEALHVSSADGQVLVGPVTTLGESFEVKTANSGPVKVPKSEVAYVRNEAAQLAYEVAAERRRNPKLTDFWSGFFDANLALARGNSEIMTVANAAGATRRTERDTIKLYFNSLFAQNATAGDTITTANVIRGGSRYELNLSDKLFTFGFVDLEYDEFQSLDLRNVIGGGFGYHAVDNERMKFDVFGGASFNQEFFNNDITRRSAEVVVGEEFSYQLNGRTSFDERFAYYPNMSDIGEHRLQFDTALVTDVFKWMAWNVTFSDRFLSNPVNGRKQNDVVLTTGVRLVFGE